MACIHSAAILPQHFNYDVSWCGPLWAHLVWDVICFFNLYVSFLHQLGKFSVIFQIGFQFLALSLSLFSFQHSHDADVGMLEVALEAPYTILMLLDSYFF